MRCKCGATITRITRKTAEKYEAADQNLCLSCLSEYLRVPYRNLLDKVNGIDACKDCMKEKQRQARRKLLGF